MINFYDQVPSIYINASRDFQYISWLINIVLNSVKHNVDDIYNLPNVSADPNLTELLAMTLGFKVKRKYNHLQLYTIVSILPSILKLKGSIEAVNLLGKALIKSSGAVGMFSCEVKNNCLEVLLPEELVDTTLFMDLLPYILPAGITCRIVRKTQIETDTKRTDLSHEDLLQAAWYKDVEFNESTQLLEGLSAMYDIDTNSNPVFSNYGNKHDESLELTAGLLDNNIIPILDSPVIETELDYIKKENEHGTTIIINKYSSTEKDDDTTIIIGEES